VPSSISLSTTSRPDSITGADLTGWFESLWMRVLGTMTDRLCDWRQLHPDDPYVVDLHDGDLVADPIGAVGRVFAAFGEQLSGGAERAMVAQLAASPQGSHGSHRHSLGSVGLTEREVRDRFARYTGLFDVAAEEPT